MWESCGNLWDVTVMWESWFLIDLVEGATGVLCWTWRRPAMIQSFLSTETECFELSIIKAQAEGGTFKSTKVNYSFYTLQICMRHGNTLSWSHKSSHKSPRPFPPTVPCIRGEAVPCVWPGTGDKGEATDSDGGWRLGCTSRECHQVRRHHDVHRSR